MAAILPCGACEGASSESNASTPYDGGVRSLPNGALEFDGKLDYATTGTAGFPSGASPQTVSLWVRYVAPLGTQVFVSLRTDYASGVNLGIRDGKVAAWTVFGNELLVKTEKLPLPGVWHHIAFVLEPVSGGGFAEALYVDGVVSATAAVTPDNRTPSSCWLGSLDGLIDFFAGDMDEIRIWRVARTASDIVLDMKGVTPLIAPGLAAHLDCNAIYGTRVRDLSGSGNDATLGGGDLTRMPALVPSNAPP